MVMEYCKRSKNRGLTWNPTRTCNGINKNLRFIIKGNSDSKYVICPTLRRSVSGWAVFLKVSQWQWKVTGNNYGFVSESNRDSYSGDVSPAYVVYHTSVRIDETVDGEIYGDWYREFSK